MPYSIKICFFGKRYRTFVFLDQKNVLVAVQIVKALYFDDIAQFLLLVNGNEKGIGSGQFFYGFLSLKLFLFSGRRDHGRRHDVDVHRRVL